MRDREQQLDMLNVERKSMGAPPPMRAHDNAGRRIPDKIGVAIHTEELEIEQGIPIPLNQRHTGTKLPLAKMQPKDSVFVPLGYNGREDLERLTGWVRGTISNWRKVNDPNWKFITKQLHNGVRFWRVR